jgi:hypothetical protein
MFLVFRPSLDVVKDGRILNEIKHLHSQPCRCFCLVLGLRQDFDEIERFDYFSVPFKKETIERGIDVYGDECYVLYNPDRPPYWLPVTVKEAHDALRKTWEDHSDKVASESMLQFIEKEYAKIPESEINNPASGIFPFSVINPENEYPPLLRINPEYWDRSLPKSAVQFIYFRSVPNKEYYRKLKEERRQKDGSYYLYYFSELFDIQNIRELLPLIGKL